MNTPMAPHSTPIAFREFVVDSIMFPFSGNLSASHYPPCIKNSQGGSYHIKWTQKRDIPNLTPSELKDFCETVVPIEISTPAKFYAFLATRFLTADI
jgi:hypothetical protein